MVLTVTLNPVLDRVVEIPSFKARGVNIVKRERARIAGGKGINVSRVLKIFDIPTVATGWLGGRVGEEIERKLKQEQIPADFIWISGESRINLTVVDPDRKKETHIVEQGPRVTEKDIRSLKDKLFKLAKKARVCVFSGSVPSGCEDKIYLELINFTKQENPDIITVLDTRGVFFKEGVKSSPYLIKPNVDELCELVEKKSLSLREITQEAIRIKNGGIKLVVVSQGAGEVVVVGDDGNYLLTPPRVSTVNTVGAGDAMVGGLIAGLYKGKNLLESCCLGVATGSASAEKGREKPLERRRITELVNKVKVRRL